MAQLERAVRSPVSTLGLILDSFPNPFSTLSLSMAFSRSSFLGREFQLKKRDFCADDLLSPPVQARLIPVSSLSTI
jgi:hypothetical protein